MKTYRGTKIKIKAETVRFYDHDFQKYDQYRAFLSTLGIPREEYGDFNTVLVEIKLAKEQNPDGL